MYTLIISLLFLTGDATHAPQKQFNTLEACQEVSKFYRQAANRSVWNDEVLSQEVEVVVVSCVKESKTEDEKKVITL